MNISDDSYYSLSGSELHEKLFKAEWLLTDGLGGWSSQSISGALTRRYHSLFLVNDEHGRTNYIPKVEEFVGAGEHVHLSTNVYSDTIYPEGFQRLEKVLIGPTVKYYYKINDETLLKEIFRPKGSAVTYLRYQWYGKKAVPLTIIPLFSFTNFHSLRKQVHHELLNISTSNNSIHVKSLESLGNLYLNSTSFEVSENRDWFYNFKLQREEERGLDSTTDLFSVLKFKRVLQPNAENIFSISSSEIGGDIIDAYHHSYSILKKNTEKVRPKGKLFSSKVKAQLDCSVQDYFIETSRHKRGVVAGYHWFEEWGRDTFITLGMMLKEDLTEDQDREDKILEIFNDFFAAQKNGIIPNRFFSASENGQVNAEYNSVDALLWAVIALWKIYNYSAEKGKYQTIWKAVFNSIDRYSSGTDYDIRAIQNESNYKGLLTAGNEHTQLTWMDAKVNGVPITPRNGLCVEINALWYNALRISSEVARELADEVRATRYQDFAFHSYQSFRKTFSIKNNGYLADRITNSEIDISFRPNQLFALSLPFPLVEQREARSILFMTEKLLLTNYGLRTLSLDDKKYVPTYEGDSWKRDSAYHQGTVWPWLLATYCDSVLRYAEGDLRPGLEKVIESLGDHLFDAGIGHVSEVFGGSDNVAGGTIAQAWSTAALRYCINKIGS